MFDPNETSNLASDSGGLAALEEMRQRLERWMKDTEDPLLDGPVPAPSGSKINDPDGISPGEPAKTVE